jgi:hypothetical protein
MKWKGTGESTLRELISIERLMSFSMNEREKLMHFKRLSPAHLTAGIVGEKVPETREKYAALLDQIAEQQRINGTAPKKVDGDQKSTRPGESKKEKGSGDRKRKRSQTDGDQPAKSREEAAKKKAMRDKRREADRAAGKCYRCHKTGHMALDCPLNEGDSEEVRAAKAAKAAAKPAESTGKAQAS